MTKDAIYQKMLISPTYDAFMQAMKAYNTRLVILHMMDSIGINLEERLKADINDDSFIDNKKYADTFERDQRFYNHFQATQGMFVQHASSVLQYFVEEIRAKYKLIALKSLNLKPADQQYIEIAAAIDMMFNSSLGENELELAFAKLKTEKFKLFDHIASAEQAQKLIMADITELMDRRYMQEATAYYGLMHIHLPGNSTYYRGIQVHPKDVAKIIEQDFTEGHYWRERSYKNHYTPGLFQFDVRLGKRSLFRPIRDTSSGISTSSTFNSAFEYANMDANTRLVYEFKPKQQRQAYKMNMALTEYVFAHFSRHEIVRIYEFNPISTECTEYSVKIHPNPNFQGIPDKPLYEDGQIIERQKDVGPSKDELQAYQWDFAFNVYQHIDTDATLTDKEKVAKRRQITLESKNYSSYVTKLQDCLNANELTLSMSRQFKKLQAALQNNDRAMVRFLQEKTKLFIGQDSNGNNLLQMAILQRDPLVFEYAMQQGADIYHNNRQGYNAIDLAVQTGNADFFEKMRASRQYNPATPNIRGQNYLWFEECLRGGLLSIRDLAKKSTSRLLTKETELMVIKKWARFKELQALPESDFYRYTSDAALTLYEIGRTNLTEVKGYMPSRVIQDEYRKLYSYGLRFDDIKHLDFENTRFLSGPEIAQFKQCYHLSGHDLLEIGIEKLRLYTSASASLLCKNYKISLAELQQLTADEIKKYGSEEAARLNIHYKLTFSELKALRFEQITLYGSVEAFRMAKHFGFNFAQLQACSPEEIGLYGSEAAERLHNFYKLSFDDLKHRGAADIEKYGGKWHFIDIHKHWSLSDLESLSNDEWKLIHSSMDYQNVIYYMNATVREIRSLIAADSQKVKLIVPICRYNSHLCKDLGFTIHILLGCELQLLQALGKEGGYYFPLETYFHLVPEEYALHRMKYIYNFRIFLFSTSIDGNTQLELAIRHNKIEYAKGIIKFAKDKGCFEELYEDIMKRRKSDDSVVTQIQSLSLTNDASQSSVPRPGF